MNHAQLAARIDASMDAHAFSGVVSVRSGAQILYERAAGYADRSNKLRNNLDTRFGIASGTKFLTALVIGQLIAAGKLALSTRLGQILALDFPHYSPEITIGHLLSHTSGIPDYLDEDETPASADFFVSRPWYELEGPRDYLAIFPQSPMKFAPGARFSYSNGGFILLGVVIEELTGQSYQSVVEEQIFRPLGMHRSGFFAFNQLPENTALGYIDGAGGWRTNIYHLPIRGASDGGAYTTAADLAILWQAFWANQILPQDLVELFSAPFARAASEGEHTWYGHGLWVDLQPGRPAQVYITGGDPGVSFRSSAQPDAGLLVTVMSNTTAGAWPVAGDIQSSLEILGGLAA
jgi:CubicO group peptidase (beta-lactamase class C family)